MEPRPMLERKRGAFDWIDIVWLLFLFGLAVLPPIDEIHKQLTLVAIGLLQVFEGRLIAWHPQRGKVYGVALKILLATLLIDHTTVVNGVYAPTIESSYYPVYYLPVVTAAIYFGPLGTLFWTIVTSLVYCSFLIPAVFIEDYELTAEGITVLLIRILFMFLAGMLVNRFAIENRRRTAQYQAVLETLEETNRQLRRAEAEARRSERLAALGQMSAGLAHEIRNPLGVIKGSAEMLSEKVRDSQPLAAELAGYISSEVNRLNSLVARFLDFARPSHLQLQKQSVAEVVDRALEAVRPQFSGAPVKVERDYAPKLPEIQLDAQLCEQVFINLITNAYQAMDGKDGRLRIAIAPERAKGKAGVGVTVEDTGPGVPPELREQIFNPFVTSKQGGVGLGLAIVAKILDDHRGWIRLETDDSKGARFRVFLPESPNT
jgi:two-component system, NtrC family, sensor histidine kinase HydH